MLLFILPKFPSLAVEKLAPARTPKPYANELCVKENNRKASKRVGIVFIIRLILIVLEIKNNSKNEGLIDFLSLHEEGLVSFLQ